MKPQRGSSPALPRQPDSRSLRDFSSPMAVTLKSSEDIARMRVAGRLAGEVLDYITPQVRPGVTTGQLNDLCHAYMVEVQGTTPAPLNYAPPGYKPYPK